MARPEPEDAYEAAMRAADALFARPSAPEPDRHAAPPKVNAAPQKLHADAAEELQPTTASSERGGRILRAIDEAPPPQFAALEAAYAPKRRGRKPGSKNKPKAPVVSSVDAAAVDLPLTELAVDRTPRAARAEPARVEAAPAATPAIQQLEGIALSDEAAPQAALRGERRAPWLRDRLKPGEGWKRRRLPRVCW